MYTATRSERTMRGRQCFGASVLLVFRTSSMATSSCCVGSITADRAVLGL
jgi:hypothetical protein